MPSHSRRSAVAATLTAFVLVVAAAVGAPAFAAPPPGKGKPTPTATPTSTPTATPTPTPTGTGPRVMVAVGDSITLAYNAAGFGSYPAYSWATGTSTTVNSQLLRLRQHTGTTVTGVNAAQVGATTAALANQLATAAGQGADYVTIEIGANDACTSTLTGMTTLETFRLRVDGALAQFHAARPDAQIFVASIPNLYRMWQISKDKYAARLIWASASICQSMLANPRSTTTTDETRRLAVQAQVDAYNAILAEECGQIATCRYDGGAVAAYQFTSTHISTADYFHPSVAGQQVLAGITWPLTRYATG